MKISMPLPFSVVPLEEQLGDIVSSFTAIRHGKGGTIEFEVIYSRIYHLTLDGGGMLVYNAALDSLRTAARYMASDKFKRFNTMISDCCLYINNAWCRPHRQVLTSAAGLQLYTDRVMVHFRLLCAFVNRIFMPYVRRQRLLLMWNEARYAPDASGAIECAERFYECGREQKSKRRRCS